MKNASMPSLRKAAVALKKAILHQDIFSGIITDFSLYSMYNRVITDKI